jgi:hypothetical protein
MKELILAPGLKQRIDDSIFYLEEVLKYQELDKTLDTGTEVAYIKSSLKTFIEIRELIK